MRLVEIRDRADEPLLDAFHAGIYLDAFAAQREPLEAWKARLWGAPAPYRLTIQLLRDGDETVAGIVHERYPRSRCGLMTYLVVAPAYRQRGAGRALIDGAIASMADCALVLGEVSDPRAFARFTRWGARALDVAYVQPSLGPGLARDRSLALLAFPPLPASVPGALVRDFLDELFTITEGATPTDAEYGAMLASIGEVVGYESRGG